MKKSLIYKLIVAVCVFGIFSLDVFAYHTLSDANNAVENGTAVLLCEYYDTADPEKKDSGAKIFYHFQRINPESSVNLPGMWDIFYRRGTIYDQLYSSIDSKQNLTYGDAQKVFMGSKRIHHNKDGQHFTLDVETNFVCPKYSFTDFNNNNELCFGDSQSCGAEFERGPFPLQKNENSIFSVIENYSKSMVYDAITVQEYASSNETKVVVTNKIKQYITNKYSFSQTKPMPKFVENYIKDVFIYVPKEETKFDQFQERMAQEANKGVEEGTVTEEEKEIVEKKNEEDYYEALGGGKVPVKPVNPSDATDCNGLLGPEMTKIVNNIFTFIQFLGPILVAVLTMMDFLKAVSSGNPDDMKKASGKLTKRLIAAALLFFIPLICNLLFGLAGITVPDNCIGK